MITKARRAELAHELAMKAREKAATVNLDEFIDTVADELGVTEPQLKLPEVIQNSPHLTEKDKQLISDSLVTLQSSPSRGDKNMDESFPKFQYSIFLDSARNGQLVIRADSWEEFVQLKTQANEIIQFSTTPANPLAQGVTAPPVYQPQPAQQAINQGVAPMCQVHGIPMLWKTGTSRSTGKPYAFWSCSGKNQDGSYCKYQPPKQ